MAWGEAAITRVAESVLRPPDTLVMIGTLRHPNWSLEDSQWIWAEFKHVAKVGK
jgi:hypothetical protein